MTLDVDGKKIETPDVETIAREFDSIKGGGVSLVIFSRDEANSLTAAGTPAEGWSGLLHETNGITRGAEISSPLRQDSAALERMESLATDRPTGHDPPPARSHPAPST